MINVFNIKVLRFTKLSLKLLSYVLICVSSSHTGYLLFRWIMGITEKNKNKGKNDHVPVAFKHFIQILRVLLIPFLHPMASQRNNVSRMSEFKIRYNMNLIVFVRVFG